MKKIFYRSNGDIQCYDFSVNHVFGARHRVGIYCVLKKDQYKVWYFNELVHRINGDAIIYDKKIKHRVKLAYKYNIRWEPDYGYRPCKYRLYDSILLINLKKLVI